MNLVWLKTADLRVEDNSALFYAAESGLTIAVFVVTPEQYQEHDDAEIKQDFWLRNLDELSKSLAKLNIPLKILYKKSFADIPKTLLKLAEENSVTHIHFNQQYEANERATEEAVNRLFSKKKIRVSNYIDSIIFEPGSIRTGQGNYYTVFTPFKKNFLRTYKERHLQVLPKPKKQQQLSIQRYSF